jgi:hypothetical protein
MRKKKLNVGLVVQVSPLFGVQPLKIFFRDKRCKKHDPDCLVRQTENEPVS